MPPLPHPMSPQDSLVAVMIAVSAADQSIRTAELVAIQTLVNHLPIFAEYDSDRIRVMAQTVFELFEEDDGLDALFGLVRDSLPEGAATVETGLCAGLRRGRPPERALCWRSPNCACWKKSAMSWGIDRLHAAAIERGARARHNDSVRGIRRGHGR